MAMWMLFLLAALAVTVSASVRQKVMLVQRLDEIQRLRLIAEAGIKQSISLIRSQTPKGYDASNDAWVIASSSMKDIQVGTGFVSIRNAGYDCQMKETVVRNGIADEERKININTANFDVLRDLFSLVLDANEAPELAACVIDWRDPDAGTVIPTGSAENPHYNNLKHPYQAHDGAFQTMDELCLVRGFSNCVVSKLAPYITIHTSGSVNINTAPLVVLQALGIPSETVDKITALRAGKDALDGTADDAVFTDIAGISALVRASYPMGEDEIKRLDEIAGRSLCVSSHNFLIVAEARLANRTRTKTTLCVYNRDTGRIVYWKE